MNQNFFTTLEAERSSLRADGNAKKGHKIGKARFRKEQCRYDRRENTRMTIAVKKSSTWKQSLQCLVAFRGPSYRPGS